MLRKKTKKPNQTPVALGTANKNFLEVVPHIQTTPTIESELVKTTKLSSNKSKSDIRVSANGNYNNSKRVAIKNILDHNHTSTNGDHESDKDNTGIFLEKSSKVTKDKATGENQNRLEIFITEDLKINQKKSTEDSEFISISNDGNSCTTVSQGNVVIDNQLSTTGAFKRAKCVHSVLNNEEINILRRHAQEAAKRNKIFTIRGSYNSVRLALKARGWVEKLEMHHKSTTFSTNHMNIGDLSQILLKRKMGETQRQFVAKVERNIMSRCIENVLCDFLWTPHKDKADHLEQSKNPNMLINKFNRTPFTNKENLNGFLRDIAAFYDEGVADIKFPRCFNVWSLEELSDFIDNFKLTACISFVHWLVDKYNGSGYEAVFSATGEIPFNSIDFAFKRCLEFVDICQHNDIDVEDPTFIWEHDWDSFLYQHYQMTHEGLKILTDGQKLVEIFITKGSEILENIQYYWPQYSIDGYQNLWIIKPANKCRGRGIHLTNNLKNIINFVNPSIATKSRFVVQKYMERPLTIHQTKFDIRQWFLISSINPLMIWMYKECYLRFSTQEYNLTNHHESVHLTNHAIQKKYTINGKRDKRLPNENMWDSFSFQAFLRQIGKQEFWLDRIYPGMRKAIVAAVLVSQDHMERTSNTFELFGADFMICENFYPWLIEINSNPDLAATTSVTARMCPQCLEDVIKVIIDRRNDAKADVGNFELIYRQNIPPTPAYMGLSLVVKGKQIANRANGHVPYLGYHRKEKPCLQPVSQFFKQRSFLTATNISQVHRPMPAFNATEYIEKCLTEAPSTSPHNKSISSISGIVSDKNADTLTRFTAVHKRSKSFSNQIMGNSRVKISGPKSIQRSLVYYSTAKRHRSCGPRLSINSTADCRDAVKPKFRMASYTQQNSMRNSECNEKNNILNTRNATLTINSSVDNFKKKLRSPLKAPSQCNRNQNPITSLKNKNTRKNSSKSEKVDNTTNSIHAIGISICSLNNNNNNNNKGHK